MKNLLTIIEENDITYEKEKNKNEIIKTIEEYVCNNCFDIIEDVNANNVRLIDLGINLKNECNKLFEIIKNLHQKVELHQGNNLPSFHNLLSLH